MGTLTTKDAKEHEGPRRETTKTQRHEGTKGDGVVGTGAVVPLRLQLAGEEANMLSCIRCGLCLSVCPTYQLTFAEEEGPRGRIAMARALHEGHVALTADLEEHSQTCLLCDACTAICPAGVKMEELGTMMREVFES